MHIITLMQSHVFHTCMHAIMVELRLPATILLLFLVSLSFNLREVWSRLASNNNSPLSPKERAAASSLNFMVVGDWGGQDNPPYYTDPEQDVAEQMGQIAAQMGAQFTLSMGDNFYDNGVTNVDDLRFKETFEVRN